MRHHTLIPLPWLAGLLALLPRAGYAADSRPEIVRETGAPQTVGVAHTVRGIPEACVRLEGVFTGDAQQPYRLATRTSRAGCRPRARWVDFASVHASENGRSENAGWRLNDVIRIPDASCPTLQAVVRVWRKPGDVAPPAPDAQGRTRIYLGEAREQAKEQIASNLPMYAAEMELAGKACSG